ncbi:MAG: hypothetical protein ACE5E9_13845 [Nitrospinaceae bacterium]
MKKKFFVCAVAFAFAFSMVLGSTAFASVKFNGPTSDFKIVKKRGADDAPGDKGPKGGKTGGKGGKKGNGKGGGKKGRGGGTEIELGG